MADTITIPNSDCGTLPLEERAGELVSAVEDVLEDMDDGLITRALILSIQTNLRAALLRFYGKQSGRAAP